MAHYENQYSAGQALRTDEYGNPVRQTDEYGNPIQQIGGTMGEYGTTGTGYGTQAGHTTGVLGGEQRQHGTLGGMLHRSGSSSSSSSSEDDGHGGRRKKKGIKDKVKEKFQEVTETT
ncbi:hypothetical protein KY290_015087 [Solanum tuberosum]|uniref:Dehydrin n=1 Tax=Solanum tuberosum TaxID=4113 RepID=A0ABQ7VSR2_SOLTU|nr:hypothetical protein KY285_014471 [Solanum tuberosum]KAH0771106.1 hypothetical protein KY290_015087 [Solanum tuberosum]